jgi:uncharacterized protein YdaU (DUF1376 family)
MAMRDQPFLKLYVQDFLTDEKLNECSASAQGVYIKIMCLFHKSETYGGILLKQKFKQNPKQIKNFASLFARLLPFDLHEIESAINELIDSEVLHLEGDFLFQKRMIKDGDISVNRSASGSLGGKKTQENNKNFAKAKSKANSQAKSKQKSEYEYEHEYEYEIEKEKGVVGEKEKTNLPARMKPAEIIQMSVTENTSSHELIDMQNKLPKGSAKKMSEIFLQMLQSTGELEKHNPDDLGRYFYNWANYHAKRMRSLFQNEENRAEIVSDYFTRSDEKQNPDEMLKSLHAYLK